MAMLYHDFHYRSWSRPPIVKFSAGDKASILLQNGFLSDCVSASEEAKKAEDASLIRSEHPKLRHELGGWLEFSHNDQLIIDMKNDFAVYTLR